ncbi:uncharacterized protein LOC107626964 [Arachis ipaensis]|uniref:uncharacterized protein LOC107626964 n=1 Tax=Arachis ipaensis TaxID=130454 RepID=UPI0007AEFD27|nr:uncharacterized protein LOC107626964 [Arachis ipaensis]
MQTRDDAYDHLLLRSFPLGYTIWLHHGEKLVEERSGLGRVDENPISQVNQMHQMVNKAFNFTLQHESEDTTTIEHAEDDEDVLPYLYEGPSHMVRDFNDLLSDGEQKLYPRCSKYSKLSFLVKLYHIKCMCSVSDKAMTMILYLLQDAFEQAKLPKTVYEDMKIIRKLGIEYTKIDACPKDCMLYRGDDENLTRCKRCRYLRWRQKNKKGSIVRLNIPVKINEKPIAAKTLCYFHLIPRLQWLFMSSKTSTDMLRHKEVRNNDGLLRHPRDAEAWKKFDAKTSFILSMLIPEPKMPGNDIDVYLQPLVDELKQLWDGVETYDVKEENTFKMCATLMWTISDFPGLENLSGWNTHSELACPTCNMDTKPHRLKDSKKWCFMGHRRFLNQGHKYRLDRNRFDEQVEGRDLLKKLSGTDVLRQQCNVHVLFGKISTMTSKKRRNEKNIYDNVVFPILSDSGKSKDNLKARKDLQCMGIRPELWPSEGGKYSSAIFTMSNSQRDNALPSPVSNVIANLSSFFRELCGKAINPMQLVDLQNHVVQTLCKMEMIFPPSFFTIMVHLTVHLVDEVNLGGPVRYRWMYPIERAQSKGTIAEGYLSEEILTFCSRYLDNIESRINQPGRVDDQPVDVTHNLGETLFPTIGKALGAVSHFKLTPMEKHQGHRHVLLNCEAVVPFVE